jgi:RNA polymerase subunit RPABC4/transcription elongation factor Spt4
MPGFLDKIKSGADKAAFEADRLRRQTQAQSALSKLKNDVNTQTAALGQKALALYDAGALAQPELLAVCQQMDALRQRIAVQEAEVERIRQEKPMDAPAPAEAPAPVPARAPAPSGHICPDCQTPLPADIRFCPECGAKAVDLAPPAPPEPPAHKVCANCGASVPAGSRFCPECGTAAA